MQPNMYENPWLFNGKPFLSEDIKNFYGFVYKITNKLTGKAYIGRKYFYKSVKKKGKRRIYIESDWKDYYSSCDELKQDVNKFGKENFLREIISLHETKGDTNYWENYELFRNNVLEAVDFKGEKLYYNNNIMNRYFIRKNKPVRLLSETYYGIQTINS